MKQLLDKDGVQQGIAESFELIGDAWEGGGAKYPLSVVGEGCAVADYVPPPPIQPPPEKVNRWITKAAFRNRFTDSEKITSELMSIDNPSDTLQKRQ